MSAWSKFLSRFRAIAGFVIVAALAGAASPLAAQQPQSQPQPLSDPQVQQLVAPVALYPDSLLAQAEVIRQ